MVWKLFKGTTRAYKRSCTFQFQMHSRWRSQDSSRGTHNFQIPPPPSPKFLECVVALSSFQCWWQGNNLWTIFLAMIIEYTAKTCWGENNAFGFTIQLAICLLLTRLFSKYVIQDSFDQWITSLLWKPTLGCGKKNRVPYLENIHHKETSTVKWIEANCDFFKTTIFFFFGYFRFFILFFFYFRLF